MNLTRPQELLLIEMGIRSLLDSLIRVKVKKVVTSKSKHSWSPARRAKFAKTMQRKWADKRAKSATK